MSQVVFLPRSHRSPSIDVEQLYARLRHNVQRIVGADVDAPDQLIEDACQVAWSRLLRHADRVRSDAALPWLVQVACHEAHKQLRRSKREVSWEATIERQGEVIALRPDPGIAAQLEGRERLADLCQLSQRQQRMLWLFAAGFSYQEISAVTGDSARTIERQLLRGRGRLRSEPQAA